MDGEVLAVNTLFYSSQSDGNSKKKKVIKFFNLGFCNKIYYKIQKIWI